MGRREKKLSNDVLLQSWFYSKYNQKVMKKAYFLTWNFLGLEL